MNDKYFIDTNILIYLYSTDELDKKDIAKNLIFSNQDKVIISTQVINEFINVLHKKKKIDFKVLSSAVQELTEVFFIASISTITIQSALLIAEKYRYSYFDSLIIASSIENNCTILVTEDMHHKHLIDNILTVKNPFSK